ncbi:MAG: RIP metalloprotease RseP [Verrucomicrobiae bacterium]|nr:RIP metalloprotease RseP [Verrucomicrobiae bacterium]
MMWEVLVWIGIIIAVFLLFGLTIFVHELGHFLFALARGMVVERFAVGFGPPVWKKKIKGVDWCVCAIPFGGYVSLPQMAPMEMLEGESKLDKGELPVAKPMDKIWAALGGPLFSALFGIFLAVIVGGVGRPIQESRMTTVIGYVEPDMPAAKAEIPLEPGDKILAIDNKPVTDYAVTPNSVVEAIAFSRRSKIQFDVERILPNGVSELVTTLIQPTKDDAVGIRRVGIMPAVRLVVGEVLENSPATMAGLRVGDEIIRIDGKKVYHPILFSDVVVKHNNQPLSFSYLRDGKEYDGVFTPQIPQGATEPFVGISWKQDLLTIVHPSPIQLVLDSLISVKKTMGAITDPNSDIKIKHMSGPLGILMMYLMLLREDIRLVLWFSVVLNINLAIVNLLPIPVVDGGHILLSAIEGVIRRPLPARLVSALQSAFAIILISFMLYVTFFDATRGLKMFSELKKAGDEAKKQEKIEFVAEPEPTNP